MSTLRSVRLNPWRETSILMLILMEVSWVTPWFRSLTPETYAVSSFRVLSIIAGMVLFAHLFVRLMDYLRLKKSIRRGLIALFILIAVFIGIKTMLYAHQPVPLSELLSRPLKSFSDLKSVIPVEFIVILTVLIAFWRGISIAQEHIGPSSVMDHFWVGIFMYVLFIFLNTLVTGETPAEFFYLFLFASLVAMVASRMAVIGMLRGGGQKKFNRYWLIAMILAASLVVGLAALLGGALGSQFTWIGAFLLGIFGAIFIIFWLLISPIITFLISTLASLLNSERIKNLSDSFQNLSQIIQGFGLKLLDLLGDSALSRFIQRWAPTLKAIVLIAILLIVIIGILAWMAIKLWQDRIRRQLSGEQVIDLKAGNVFQQLLDFLKQGLISAKNTLAQMTDFNRRQRLRAAARIRQVYADLMDLCDALGHARDQSQTPLEYLPQLERLFPEQKLEASLITQAYNSVRYGLLPETRQEVEQVEAAWDKLQFAGRELSNTKTHANKK